MMPRLPASNKIIQMFESLKLAETFPNFEKISIKITFLVNTSRRLDQYNFKTRLENVKQTLEIKTTVFLLNNYKKGKFLIFFAKL